MKKLILYVIFLFSLAISVQGQRSDYWQKFSDVSVERNKIAMRQSFATNFILFKNLTNLQQLVANAPKRLQSNSSSVEIVLPNMAGNLERFHIFEFSNFDAQLQSQFPNIRSYVGIGIDDITARVRFSLDSDGLQAMVSRANKPTEFIEPYSLDKTVYAVHEASNKKGALPFVCSTEDETVFRNLEIKTADLQNKSNSGQLLDFRLAMSCNGEYSIFHGGTIAGALAAINATITRVNGVFENDFAIHLTIIANTTSVIFLDPATDPYSTNLNAWNAQLQATLTSVIGEANYDVGHMFGASGGGGSAGCIGCVCENGKGSGKTSPSDNVPAGDTFDIDYVAHELGHQFGGNHTFSQNVEGSGVNVEPGSGSTVMGYAGITSQDVQQNSDAYFVYASIKQVQDNMVGKTCPTRINLGRIAPIVNAGPDLTIPKSTPFVLTGSVAVANPNLTYTWEQNDTATSQTGVQSGASATKTGGPNFRSYTPTGSPSRYFPRIQSILANATTTQGQEILTEALNSNARVLNFVLTARDNFAGAGQTGTDDKRITVNNIAGPFLVTFPNLATESFAAGTNQTINWNVAGTTANNVNTEFVDIFMSSDGGFTYPTLLASKVPNDGSEIITIPNLIGTTNRIMVKGYNHVFFDISNFNFSITAPTTNFSIGYNGVAEQQNKETCAGNGSTVFTFPYTTYNGFSGVTDFTLTGLPTNAVGTFSQNSATSNVSVSLSITTVNVAPGIYTLVATATSGATVVNTPFYLQVYSANFAAVTLTNPVNLAITQPVSINFTWQPEANATSYDFQLATDSNFANIIESVNVTATNYSVSNLAEVTNYFWRVLPKNPSCEGVFGNSFTFSTGQIVCSDAVSTNVPIAIPTTANATVNSTLTVTDTSVISGLSVNINVQHTWVNDMTITLISPAGTQVQLVNRPCSSSALNDIIATFDDNAAVVSCANNPAISGTVKPIQLLSAFNGETANGVWTLRVLDSFNADGGSINGWSLNVCSTQAPLSVATTSFEDLAIYPNPTKDLITIEFQPQSSEKIEVEVFDLRGRQISLKKYENTSNFSEVISLSAFEAGIYLVKIKNGESVITKKIIKE